MTGIVPNVGTTVCPECHTMQRVYRHSRAVPGRPLAIAVHFLSGGEYCKGTGQRVQPARVTKS